MTTIAIPSDVLNSMKIPRSDQEQALKLELALALYQRGILAMPSPAAGRYIKTGVSRRAGKENFKFPVECRRPAIAIGHKGLKALKVIQKFLLAGICLCQTPIQLGYCL